MQGEAFWGLKNSENPGASGALPPGPLPGLCPWTPPGALELAPGPHAVKTLHSLRSIWTHSFYSAPRSNKSYTCPWIHLTMKNEKWTFPRNTKPDKKGPGVSSWGNDSFCGWKQRLGGTHMSEVYGYVRLWRPPFSDAFAAPKTHLFSPSVRSYALCFPFFEKHF